VTDDACCNSLLHDDDAAARRLGIEGFHALWHGEQPAVSDLCDDPGVVERLVNAGRLELDDEGRVAGVHGLVARETRHRILLASRAVHTWCAFDAIGIPAALEVDATAETACPTCEQPISLTTEQGVVSDHGELCLWLPAADCRHLIDDFCRHANLFCNREHLVAAVGTDAEGDVLSVSEAAALGRRTWNDVAAGTSP
jgi:alkylmercury lyase